MLLSCRILLLNAFPIFLKAATTPERQNLEILRRGQFERIRDEIGTNPARKPGFGKPRMHPTAGATQRHPAYLSSVSSVLLFRSWASPVGSVRKAIEEQPVTVRGWRWIGDDTLGTLIAASVIALRHVLDGDRISSLLSSWVVRSAITLWT